MGTIGVCLKSGGFTLYSKQETSMYGWVYITRGLRSPILRLPGSSQSSSQTGVTVSFLTPYTSVHLFPFLSYICVRISVVFFSHFVGHFY